MSPRATPVRRRDETSPTGPSYLGDWWRSRFDPFETSLEQYNPDVVPLEDLRDVELEVGALIVAFLVRHATGWDRRDIIRGMRDLYALHADVPIGELVQEVVRSDEAVLREAGLADAQAALRRAEEETDEVRRARRVRRAESMVQANGQSRWSCYLLAVNKLWMFASHGIGTRGLGDRSPTSGLMSTHSVAVERRALTEEEMDFVWAAAASFTDPDLAVMVLDFLRETATRRQSAIDLMLDDVNWSESTALLHVKGGGTKTAVISGELMERMVLRAVELGWDGQPASRQDARTPERAVFRRANGKPIDRRWFDRLVNHIDATLTAEGVRLEGRFTPHYLRHTTLTQIERNLGMYAAAQYAGHSPRSGAPLQMHSTPNYTTWTIPEFKSVFEALFPKTPPYGVDPVAIAEKYAYLRETGQLG